MRRLLLLALSAVLFLSACDDGGDQDIMANESSAYMGGAADGMAFARSAKMMAAPQADMIAPAPMSGNNAALEPAAPPSTMVLDRTKFKGRRIAETHNMSIETPYNVLQSRYQRDYAKCIELECEIVNSNIQLEQGGNIYARIDPAKLGQFLDFLGTGQGRILNHNVSADDQSDEFSDLNAQMDNLIAMRERLRKLLDSYKAEKVDDILRIEQELNRIQTEIDMRTARLRNLERVTNMATVNLSYSVEYRPAEAKPYELKNTFKNATQQFYRALDRMIQFVGRVLPWIPVIAVGFWLTVWIVRLAFRRVSFRWPWKK